MPHFLAVRRNMLMKMEEQKTYPNRLFVVLWKQLVWVFRFLFPQKILWNNDPANKMVDERANGDELYLFQYIQYINGMYKIVWFERCARVHAHFFCTISTEFPSIFGVWVLRFIVTIQMFHTIYTMCSCFCWICMRLCNWHTHTNTYPSQVHRKPVQAQHIVAKIHWQTFLKHEYCVECAKLSSSSFSFSRLFP